MKIEYVDTVPNREYRGRERIKEYKILKTFMESSRGILKITYDTPMEARKRRQSIATTIKRESIPVFTAVRKNELYFIKKEEGDE